MHGSAFTSSAGGKNVLLVVAVLGLLNSGLRLATGSSGAARAFWASFGAVWVVLGYIALRQRLYLNRQQRR